MEQQFVNCDRTALRLFRLGIRPSVLLAAIMLIGAVLRFHDLAAHGMWYDEGFTLAYASKIDSSLRAFSPEVTTDAPLMATLMHFWQKGLALFPALRPGSVAYDWMLRLVACLFSLATIPLAYRAAQLIVADTSAALIAALFTAISPFQIVYAHDIKPYSLYLMLSLLTVILALQALEEDRKRSWFALPIVMGLAFYSHFFAAWNVATLNLFFLLCIRRYWRHFWKWSAVQVCFVLLSAPGLWQAALTNVMFQSVRNIYTIHPDFKSAFITFKTFFAGYGPHPAVYYTLLIAGGVAFIAGMWTLRGRLHMLALVFCLTFVPIIGNVVFWRMRRFPMYEHRLFILASIIVYAAVALAFVRLPWRRLRLPALAAFIAVMLPGLDDYYHQRLHPNMTHRMGVRYQVDNRDAASYIAERLQPGDVVTHASHFTYFPFYYYLAGKAVPQCTVRVTDDDLQGFLDALPKPALWDAYGALPVRLEEATASAARVWWVESWWEPFEIPKSVVAMRGWLDGHFRKAELHRFDGLTVTLYTRDGQRTPQQLVDTATAWGVEYDCVKSTLTVNNPANMPRKLEGTVTGAAYVIEPLEFTRQDTNCDVWRPWFECLPDRDATPTNAFAVGASLTHEKNNGAALYKDITPSRGEYAIFLRTFNDNASVNRYRANLVLHQTGVAGNSADNVLGRIVGDDPSAPVGWGWRAAGRLQADGNPLRLTVTVHNDDDLRRAYANLGRLALVPVASGEAAPTTPEIEQFSLEIAPMTCKIRTVTLPNPLRGTNRIDIDLYDPSVHEHCHIFFAAPRP